MITEAIVEMLVKIAETMGGYVPITATSPHVTADEMTGQALVKAGLDLNEVNRAIAQVLQDLDNPAWTELAVLEHGLLYVTDRDDVSQYLASRES